MIEIRAKLQRKHFKLDVSLQIDTRVTAIYGPSGSGKSTILSLIAGITQPDSGYIAIDGECVFDSESKLNKPIHQRRIGLVFQDGRLFPHMNVEQNLTYAFKLNAHQQQLIQPAEIMQLLALDTLKKQHPHQLSGGEKQRVALGRALLSSPKLLMLDEPLASLDDKLKQQILPYLKLVAENIQVPMLYVSHSKDEISQLTSEIIYLQKGRVRTEY
ncbi:MAG: ATP-binding cassette domain-containing protein [Pseudomonadota bacterium]